MTVPVEIVKGKIYLIRGQKVLLDSDLAELYGVTTANLNKAVKRNIERFPDDFMFQLAVEEAGNLIFQSGISNSRIFEVTNCDLKRIFTKLQPRRIIKRWRGSK